MDECGMRSRKQVSRGVCIWESFPLSPPSYRLRRFDASFLSLRAKSLMSKSALPMLTLVNTIIQV